MKSSSAPRKILRLAQHPLVIRPVFFGVFLSICLAGCGGSDNTGAAAAANAAPSAHAATQRSLLLSAEDLLTVGDQTLASGPIITGSIQPERRADLRAEVPAVVLEVLKENGDPVRRGDTLVRLDDTAIRDSLASAEASARAAAQAYEQAERQYQRLAKLQETGVVSVQAAEDAQITRNSAQSELAAARTTVATARQQSQRTIVRAPFDGIVSDRKVSAGDTAQVGKELLKVIDPQSMRFEGRVSADHVGAIGVGQQVVFRIQGLGEREFVGEITRVNPSANATTRQLEVLVDFKNGGAQPQLAGLYAEGRIDTGGPEDLMIPASAVVQEGTGSFAWRLQAGVLQKVPVQLAQRDARSGAYVLMRGLAPGDKVLRYPNEHLQDGQKVEMAMASRAPSAAGAAGGR